MQTHAALEGVHAALEVALLTVPHRLPSAQIARLVDKCQQLANTLQPPPYYILCEAADAIGPFLGLVDLARLSGTCAAWRVSLRSLQLRCPYKASTFHMMHLLSKSVWAHCVDTIALNVGMPLQTACRDDVNDCTLNLRVYVALLPCFPNLRSLEIEAGMYYSLDAEFLCISLSKCKQLCNMEIRGGCFFRSFRISAYDSASGWALMIQRRKPNA